MSYMSNFNSLPHAEVDGNWNEFLENERLFQLTTSRRGRQEPYRNSSTDYYFNSLPHAEVDNGVENKRILELQFQLTTSRRGRLISNRIVCIRGNFNSLPHAEVDETGMLCTDSLQYFNSLPHAEVDYSHGTISNSFRISTHYLTQR